MLAPAAAGSVFEMDGAFHQGTFFAFSLFGKFLAFVLVRLRLMLADGRVVSALVPIAQMNPSNSRATAVMIFPWGLPAAPSFT